MKKTYYTSDWHLGEDRIGINGKPNLFYRPFGDIDIQNDIILDNLADVFQDGDTLIHLGDVIFNFAENVKTSLEFMKNAFPNSKFKLILGNYDVGKEDILKNYFEIIGDETTVVIKDREYYLNHYPVKCVDKQFSITGHIHGLWKVQKNMINVGVDAWHFRPVSEEQIDFCRTACEKYYDNNVFPF